MNPLELYVLHTVQMIPGEPPGHSAYLYFDQEAARRAGEKLKAEKPPEAPIFEFSVVPLEGAV